jgi:hypothetical protein
VSKQVNTLFSDEQYENLRKLAFHCRTSISALVRFLVTSSSPAHVEDIKQQITSNDVDPVTSRDDSPIDPVKLDEP